jgi:hypothetical protein
MNKYIKKSPKKNYRVRSLKVNKKKSPKKNYRVRSLKVNKKKKINQVDSGIISWATDEHKSKILDNIPEEKFCKLIENVIIKKNEGRHNDGIGFITIEGNEYFLKYGDDNILKEFKTGFYLSKLNNIYPYFLNVHSVLKCDYIPRNRKDKKKGYVMIADKGNETIFDYLNRNTKEYFIKLIPDIIDRTNELDSKIEKIIGISDDNWISYEELENEEINKLIEDYYLNISKEFLTFTVEFIPMFIRNYKAILNSFILVDIMTLKKYNNYIGDRKSDNFMIHTETFSNDENEKMKIQLGEHEFLLNNICTWGTKKEKCYIFPVDFGSLDIDIESIDFPDKILYKYFYNSWIASLCKNKLYSDKDDVLYLNNSININFSKYRVKLRTIFEKKNPFKIKIFNPMSYVFSLGAESIIPPKESLSKLKKDDYRFQCTSYDKYDIDKLEEAINIILTIYSGSTLIEEAYKNPYLRYSYKYRAYSSEINFLSLNGLPDISNSLSPPHRIFNTDIE